MSTDNLPAVRHSVSDIELMSAQVAKSGLFGMTQPQLFTMMLLSQAKGIHPIQAVERYHVISGRPAMKADAMLADFQARGGKVKWGEHTHQRVEATFSAPSLEEPVTIAWTIEDARKAQLTGNKMYEKYSRQMLRARVISEGIRMAMPGVVAGIYTPEEVEDMEPKRVAATFVEARPTFTNNTGHKSGKYASDEQVEAYKKWLAGFVDEVNAKWLDHWTNRATDGTTGLPNGIGDLVNVWRLSNHLCKVLREAGAIQAPEEFKVSQTDRLVAIVHAADPEAVEVEARVYCRKLWGVTKAEFEAKLSTGEEATGRDVCDADGYEDEDEDGAANDGDDLATTEAGSRG